MAYVYIVKGDKTIHQQVNHVFPSTIREAFGIPSDVPVILEKGQLQYVSTRMNTFNRPLKSGKYWLISSNSKTYNASEIGTLKDTSISDLTLCNGNVRFHYGDEFFDLNTSKGNGITHRTLVSEVSKRVNHKFRETSLDIFSSDGVEVKDNEFTANKEYYLHFPCQQPLEGPCHVPTLYEPIINQISCRLTDADGTLYLTDLLMPFVAVAKICHYLGTSADDYELSSRRYPIFSTSFKTCIVEAGLKFNAAFASINELTVDSTDPKSLKQGILDFLDCSRQAEVTLDDILSNTFSQSKGTKNPKPSFECLQSAAAAHIFHNGYETTNHPLRRLDRQVIKNFGPKPESFFKRLEKFKIDGVVKLCDLSSFYKHYRTIVMPLLEATKRFDFSLEAVFDMLHVLLKIVSRTNRLFEYYPALLTQIDNQADILEEKVADLPQPSNKIHVDYATCIKFLQAVGPYGYTPDFTMPLEFSVFKNSLEDAQFVYAKAVNAEFVDQSNSLM